MSNMLLSPRLSQKILFILQSIYICTFGSVILSGGPYCTDGGSVQHAVPGTVISITCAVDNPSPGANLLQWTIPSYGVSVSNVNGADGANIDQPDFVSTVNSFNNTEGTTNATLTFTAVSELNEAVVNCADVTTVTSSCTLYILTSPGAPYDLRCLNITYYSITLEWTPPDSGEEEISHYEITRTPGGTVITTVGTAVDFTEMNLDPRENYTFSIRANSSLGFGDPSVLTCSTIGDVFDTVSSVEVCLGNNEDGDFLAITISSQNDCPPSSPDIITTPPFDNFTITVSGFDPVYTNSCVFNQPISVEKEYDITITVNNQVGPSEPTTKHIDSHWIKNVVISSNTGVLSYSVVDCTTIEDAIVSLTITASESFAQSHPFNRSYTTFYIGSLSPDTSYEYVLLVTRPGGTTLASHTDLILPTVTHQSTMTSTATHQSTIAIPTVSDTSYSDQLSISVIAGISVAIVFLVIIVLTVSVTFIMMCLCVRHKRSVKLPQDYETPICATTVPLEMKINAAYGQVHVPEMKTNEGYGEVRYTTEPTDKQTSVYETITA